MRNRAELPHRVELIESTVTRIRSSPKLRHDGKTDPSVNTIDREIVAVHCEDLPDAFTLCHSDKCRVGEIYRAVGILDHELSYAGYVHQVESKESHRSSRQHLPESFLGFGKIAQQIDGLDEGRPHGDQGLSQALQAIDALFVILIVSIDKRHKWSSVDENHLLFRRFLRISENRRPIWVERPGTPP